MYMVSDYMIMINGLKTISKKENKQTKKSMKILACA